MLCLGQVGHACFLSCDTLSCMLYAVALSLLFFLFYADPAFDYAIQYQLRLDHLPRVGEHLQLCLLPKEVVVLYFNPFNHLPR